MDFSELKNWLTDPNERFIFVEDGKPAYVFMGFAAYRALKGEPEEGRKYVSSGLAEPKDLIDLANARLELERVKTQELAVKMAMEQADRRSTSSPMSRRDSSEIRLEDLPL